MPVEWMRGNLSGRQDLSYDGQRAYSIPTGEKVSASAYQPRLIAKVLRAPFANRRKYFQVRTKTSVYMTESMRFNLACMGGACALYSSLVSNKESAIYQACIAATPDGMTLRAFIVPILRVGLAAKEEAIEISSGINIVNPWISTSTPNVPLSQSILDKFNSELSNS